MINDWIWSGGHPVKVQSIYKNKIKILDVYYPEIEDVSPLTLTDEMLLLNGFEFYDGGTRNTTFYTFRGNGKVFILGKEPRVFKVHTKILQEEIYFKYVHELQQALRLCGLREEADNFKVSKD